MSLAWDVVSVDKPDDVNVVIGQAHFIKAVEDLHEAMVGVSPSLRFGLAFCEASGPRLVRHTGNDGDLVELATRTALAIAAGHSFVIFLREGFPINILNPVQAVPEVCTIYCATANPVDVVVAVTPHGRGIVGVVDGQTLWEWRPIATLRSGVTCCAPSVTSSDTGRRSALDSGTSAAEGRRHVRGARDRSG